jgi:uncharacterized membrane protein
MSQTTGMPGIIQPADASLVTYTHVIYALHSLSVLMGLATTASIVFSFVGGLPSIVAVIMNYARRSDTRGTFLESHFRWQIRTFWFALLWLIIVNVVAWPLVAIIIGLPILLLGTVAIGVWIVYRVVRGWLALRDQRPMYV